MKAYMVVRYDWDETNIDSFWLNKKSAEKRRKEVSKKDKQQQMEVEESTRIRWEKYSKEEKYKQLGLADISYETIKYEDLWRVREIEIKEN